MRLLALRIKTTERSKRAVILKSHVDFLCYRVSDFEVRSELETFLLTLTRRHIQPRLRLKAVLQTSKAVSRFACHPSPITMHRAMTSEPHNIGDLLEQRVARTPDRAFLISEPDGRQFTYAEFSAAVDRAAGMLKAHGIRKGDVVSLLMPNSAEYIIGYLACWQLGALAGPVNSLLKEHEIEFVMNNSEAKAILVHSEFQPRIENIRGELRHLKSVIEFDDEAVATRE